jgi:hypothetical protein
MSAVLFKERLSKLIGDRTSKCSRFISGEVHSSIICKLNLLQRRRKATDQPRVPTYRWVQSMAVVRYGEGARKLIRKGNGLEVLPESRLFVVMHEAHINLARSHLRTNCPLRLGPAHRPTCCHMVHPHRLLPTGQGPRWRPLPRLARSVQPDGTRRHPTQTPRGTRPARSRTPVLGDIRWVTTAATYYSARARGSHTLTSHI